MMSMSENDDAALVIIWSTVETSAQTIQTFFDLASYCGRPALRDLEAIMVCSPVQWKGILDRS